MEFLLPVETKVQLSRKTFNMYGQSNGAEDVPIVYLHRFFIEILDPIVAEIMLT